MAQFTIYKSTDGSAPVLSGTNNSLVALLDACLVTGYGSKAAAGWTKPFTGTNKAVFRPGAGNQHYLRVQDDGPGAGVAREARITGYETMSDVDTGTGPFPTAALGVGGIAMVAVRKSTTADATARPWIIAADNRTVYVFVQTGDAANQYLAWMFGDIYSFLAGDLYKTMIIGRIAENSGSNVNERFGDAYHLISASMGGHFIARGHTAIGGAVSIGKTGDNSKSGNNAPCAFSGVIPFTNPSDGGLFIAQLWVFDPVTTPANGIRGRMRGLWQFLHPIGSVVDGDTFSGVGELAGKTFLCIKQGAGSGGVSGVYIIETSNTLETN